MSGWGSAIAAIGGAAGGINNQMRFDATMDQKKELENARQLLAILREQGVNDRAALSDATRQRGQDLTDEQRRQQRLEAREKADADRELRSRDVTGRLEHLGRSDAQGQQRIDNRFDEFWGGTVPLGYQRDDTTRRGQDTTATTARRGQDMTAATSTANAALASETSQRNADVGAAVTQRGQTATDTRGRAAIRGRNAWANLFAPDGSAPEIAIPAAPPEVVPPPRVAPPVGPRQAAPPAAAAAPAGQKTVSAAQLAAVARAKGTTVDVQRARAVAEGFTIVP